MVKHARTFDALLTPIGLSSNHKRYDITESKLVTLRTCTINKMENVNIQCEACLLFTGGEVCFWVGEGGDNEVRVKNI